MAKIDAETSGENIPSTAVEAPAPLGEDATKVDRPALSELTGIKFSGDMIDRRAISAADLRRLGAEPRDEEDLVWSAENDFIVPISQLNASTVDRLITIPGFSAI